MINDDGGDQADIDSAMDLLNQVEIFDEVMERDTTPLDEEEIEEAEAKIAQLHPMGKLRLWQIFPSLKPIIKRCCKENLEEAKKLHESLVEEYTEQNDHMERVINSYGEPFTGGTLAELISTDVNLDEHSTKRSFKFFNDDSGDIDPFQELGFGFTAYLSMLSKFAGLFCLFTLLTIPVLGLYIQEGALEGYRNYSKAQYSLGNFGFSQALCMSQYVTLNAPRNITCPTGNLNMLYSYGIAPKNITSGEQDYCGPSSNLYDVDECTENNMDGTSLLAYWNSTCANHVSCSIDIAQYVLHTGIDAPGVDTTFDTSSYTSCQDQNARVYIQYFCVQEETEILQKRTKGLFVSCVGIFICLLYLFLIGYLNKVGTLDYKLWDVQTVTAADFTVEQMITQEFWDKYNQEIASNSSEFGTSMDLETYLRQEYERIILAQPAVLDHTVDKIRIVNITFSYDNHELIQLLIKRGSLCTAGKFDQLPRLDKKIDELKQEKQEAFTRPVGAFITFDTQEGYERACNIKGKIKWTGKVKAENKFLGEPLFFKEASEPSNIIWENRHTTPKQQFCSKIYATIGITLVLFFALVFFSVLKIQSVKKSLKYPENTDCDEIDMLFTEPDGSFNQTKFQLYAVIDYDATQDSEGTGIYQCYCEDQNITFYSVSNVTDSCYVFSQDTSDAFLLSQVVSYSIIIVNVLLRSVNIFFIKRVGLHTISEEIQSVMTAIFLSTFINTAILLLLTNANFSESLFGFIPMTEQYTDLTASWYIEIGPSLISTMVVNSIYCWIDLGINFGMKCVLRVIDRRACCYWRHKTTRKLTIQQYVNLYSGSQHAMHFKYSMVMVVTFVTFMYGLSMPMLFPLAVFTYVNQYICEKLTLAYFYPSPPSYDDKLNKAALSILKWPPVFMCFFGYWCLGSLQIFSNVVEPLVTASQPVPTGHTGAPIINQSLPLFIAGIVFLVMLLFVNSTTKCCRKCGCLVKEDEDEVDEGLGSYYNCVSARDRKRWYCEEIYNKNKLGVKTVDDEVLELIRTSKTGSKVLKNAYNYEILSNHRYVAAFQYCPVEIRDTDEEIKVSDMVTKILFLGNTHISQRDFSFKMTGPQKQKTVDEEQTEPAVSNPIN